MQQTGIICSADSSLNVSKENQFLGLDIERACDSFFARVDAPRVLFIGDREAENWRELNKFSGQHPGSIEPLGIITPGVDIDELVKAIDSVKKSEFGYGLNGDCPHIHAAYDSKMLKDSDYRSEYMRQLSEKIESLNPNIIFLSNFKLTLSEELVRKFDRMIINVHPSVLPLLKGFRSEREVVNNSRHTEASGYTFHYVSKELDGGAVLFQQKVSIPAYDYDLETKMGKSEYHLLREEQHRFDIIKAQSVWSAKILATIGAGWEKNMDGVKIVEDEEAFSIEGRPDFMQTAGYLESLQLDYQHFLTENKTDVTFETWRENLRVPYRRVLFNMGMGFQTLENILNSPSEVCAGQSPGLAVYRIHTGLSNRENFRNFACEMEKLRLQNPSDFNILNVKLDFSQNKISGVLVGSSSGKIEELLKLHRINQWEKEDLKVRVNTKRRQANRSAA